MNTMHLEPMPPERAGCRNGSLGMSRLINAALVDPEFCELLLSRPALALSRGFNQEAFSLSPQEIHFVLTTQAASLADFATRWVGKGQQDHTLLQPDILPSQWILASLSQD